MKNSKLDHQIKKCLQEQAKLFEQSADTDNEWNQILSRLQEQKMEDNQMKHFNLKKGIIATAAAVLVLGTISIASGKVTSIVSHSLSFPEYTKYTDLSRAEARAGVISDAPEGFSNGYSFYGINISSDSYQNEDGTAIDQFKSLSVEYRNGSDRVKYDIQPRPMFIDTEKFPYEVFEQDGISYYYLEMRSKWVPVGYEPTEEEKARMEAGSLNIGVGASEISYSDSKSITWEVNGQARSLFCMDNDISKEDFLNMAFEIQ